MTAVEVVSWSPWNQHPSIVHLWTNLGEQLFNPFFIEYCDHPSLSCCVTLSLSLAWLWGKLLISGGWNASHCGPSWRPEAGLCGRKVIPPVREEEPSREKTNRTKQERRTSYSQLLVAALKIKAQSQGGQDEFSTLALCYFSPGWCRWPQYRAMSLSTFYIPPSQLLVAESIPAVPNS